MSEGGTPISVATLSLFHFPGTASRLWVLGQMALARLGLSRQAGLTFYKLCGSGTGEGFTPRPNWQVWAIFAVWVDEGAARHGVAASPVWRGWSKRAAQTMTVYLWPLSARGEWAGHNPFRDRGPAQRPADDAPYAILTRATVKPRHMLRFWRRVPDISGAIGENQDVLFKIGIGEVPLLHQVTFSIWPDTDSMKAFAHADGPHARAIRAVREGDWFSEELYARFRVLGMTGHWNDAPRLAAVRNREDAA